MKCAAVHCWSTGGCNDANKLEKGEGIGLLNVLASVSL